MLARFMATDRAFGKLRRTRSGAIAREHGGDIVLAARKGGGFSARLELPA
jgi:hypothetical protein